MFSKEAKRVQKCIILNICLLIVAFTMTLVFNDSTSLYFRAGPSENLVLLGITINTWGKYYILNGVLATFQIADIIINEIASPLLGFTVYNPDKKIIDNFGRVELQIYASFFFSTNNIKSVLLLILSITQIDLALLKVLYGELATIFTVRYLLKQKEFRKNNDQEEKQLIEISDFT